MTHSPSRRVPRTLFLGLGIILVCEALLFTDVALSHRWAVRSQIERVSIAPPTPGIGQAARWMAANMCACVWLGYIIFLEGLIYWIRGHSPVRRRPHHFAFLCLASVAIWCVFDIINFNLGMKAWIYVGMPGSTDQAGNILIPGGFLDRAWGYFIAFAAIVPGMVMSGQALLDLGAFNWARSRAGGPRTPRWMLLASLAVGAAMLAWVLVTRAPVTNYVMWTSLVFLLDPLNYWLGRPSMFRDFERGWFGRILAACAGGLICGFLWEFWNFWALTKWTYHLPFLGWTESIKYFEMPIVGLMGFIPFGAECWIMWQLMRVPLDGLAEPLVDDRDLY